MNNNGNYLYEKKWKEKVDRVVTNHPDCYLKEFINYNTKLSYVTLKDYIAYIIDFNKFINKNITQVTFDDFTSYMNSLRETSPSNQIVAYSALKKYNKYLCISDKIKTNYMLSIDRPNATERQSTIEKRKKGYLTKDELETYLDNVKYTLHEWRKRDLFLITLFLNTGLRCSGVWKLNVSDIDVNNKTLTTTEKRGKVRTYPLSDNLIKLYNDWIEDRKYYAKKDEVALFVSQKGTRLSTMRMWNIIKSYAYNIKDKNISPHKLRATFGTQVYEATKDIYLTQQVMGHNSPKTTELYIRGTDNKNINIATNIMDNLTR